MDLKILGRLAGYHSHRSLAGLSYALHQRSRDLNALDDAIREERLAIAEWEGIVAAAGDVYAENMMMGRPWVDLAGHWKDELAALKKGLAGLEAQRKSFRPETGRVVARFDFGTGPAREGFQRVRRQTAFSAPLPSGDYLLKFTVEGDGKGSGPMWIEANGADYSEPFRVPAGGVVEKSIETTVADGKLHVVFDAVSSARWNVTTMTVSERGPRIAHVPVRRAAPSRQLTVSATIGVEAGPALAFVLYGSRSRGFARAAMREAGPGLYRGVVPAERVEPGLEYRIEAADARGGHGRTAPVQVVVSSDLEPPAVVHKPVASAPAGAAVRVVADVSDASGVKSVRLRYRAVNQHQDFQTLEMLPAGRGGRYEAEIPARHISPRWDLMYFIEAVDQAGNGKICPDIEKETPYVVVKLDR